VQSILGFSILKEVSDDSGADLHHLVKQAANIALKKDRVARQSPERSQAHRITLDEECFNEALNSTRPSVSEFNRKRYETLRQQFEMR
jgi:SpoVK/Ycf46/Vps4 family AAA+-type ATPase